MAFTKKLKSIISDIRESTAKSPEEETIPAELIESPAVTKFKEHLADTNDPQKDRELIDSIEPEYFNDDSFDPSNFELQKLPEQLDLAEIDGDRKRLKKQLQALSRKVSELVLENHPAYAAELQRVMELQANLQSATIICANGRRQLACAQQGFTTASLGLLSNYHRRQQLVELLHSLSTIKTLQRTDVRLREMVEEEDYPGAIQLCLECIKAAHAYRHFHCISDLRTKLQDTLVELEDSLDKALSKTCGGFDEQHYEKVQKAYQLLGKTQTAMDQLLMHFTNAIHNTAFQIVVGYVELCSGKPGETNFQKLPYPDLCKYVTSELFTVCLVDLSKALWEVMKSYHNMMRWHEKNDSGDDEDETPATNDDSLDSTMDREYIRQKLLHGLTRVWTDVQTKVKAYLLSTDMSSFKYDEFIRVLDIVNRLIQIGEEFCGSKSEALQDSIRRQSLSYFRTYHRARLDELRMFLENEGWEMCPVKHNFSILMLQEFRFMRKKSVDGSLNYSVIEAATATVPSDKAMESYFTRFASTGNPFDVVTEDEEREDVMDVSGFGDEGDVETDSDDDIPDELKQDFIDEQTGDTPQAVGTGGPVKRVPSYRRRKSRDKNRLGGKQAPIVTNTTLNVCRLFGKYMQMMSILKPIAFDVIICMSQLLDYYLYTIYTFFAAAEEDNEYHLQCLSSRLRGTLKRVYDNLILDENEQNSNIEERVPSPHISPIVDLTSPNRLFGLPERVVATESLVFLAHQFEFLQPHLEALIPAAKKAFLQQFYSQTVSVTSELRRPVYRLVSAQACHFSRQLELMTSVRWDVKELMSQHSTYVDVLLQELATFGKQLQTVSHTPIPKAVTDVLWEHSITLASRTFVEGFAGAKKCTNEGRALMQLDFQQFLMKLEKITDLRPIPGREYVELYIKAYYLPEAQLESWIKEHKEYTVRQLINLVNCVPHINKKARQRLSTLVEERRAAVQLAAQT